MKKLITVLILSISLIMCTALIASADDSENPLNLKMTKCTSDSMTFTWDKTTSYNGQAINNWVLLAYDLENFDGEFDANDFDATTVVKGTANTAGLGGLKAGRIYIVTLVPDTIDLVSATEANTTPIKMKTGNFVVSPKTNTSVTFDANVPAYASGVQIQLYKYSSSTALSKKTYKSTFSVKANTAYKYRARAYYKNETLGKTFYGSWSSYRYFDNPSLTYTKVKGGAKIKAKGVSGVKNYKVYVSTSSSKKGSYTTTITPKSGKYLTKKITRIGSSTMKKGKTYYVKVYPIMKNGKTSDVYSKFSFKRS